MKEKKYKPSNIKVFEETFTLCKLDHDTDHVYLGEKVEEKKPRKTPTVIGVLGDLWDRLHSRKRGSLNTSSGAGMVLVIIIFAIFLWALYCFTPWLIERFGGEGKENVEGCLLWI